MYPLVMCVCLYHTVPLVACCERPGLLTFLYVTIVCDDFMCFCHLPIPCPGSCVVLNCIDS